MTHERPISILCVDDDPDVREVFKKILSLEPGFTVETSPCAEDALERVKVRHFDAIVADFAMPGMDGIGLLKEIRSRGLNSVFTIVTGKRLAHIAIDALNNGADYYIHKGPDTAKDMGKLSEFIRTHAIMKNDDSTQGEWERFYASCVEGSTDVIFRIQPNGIFSFANEFSVQFFKRPQDALLKSSFFVLIPENERQEVLTRLQGLTREKPVVLMVHHVITGDGESPLLQWKYQGIFSSGKKASEYLVSGRDTEGLIKIGSTVTAQPIIPKPPSRPVIMKAPPAPVAFRLAPTAEAPAPCPAPAPVPILPVPTVQAPVSYPPALVHIPPAPTVEAPVLYPPAPVPVPPAPTVQAPVSYPPAPVPFPPERTVKGPISFPRAQVPVPHARMVRAPVSFPPAPVPVPPVPAVQAPVSSPAPVPAAEPRSDDWESLVETVNSIESPVFAVNRAGIVIAWNKALGELTGVTSETIVGKGNREYAVPFYGKPAPMLIDHIILPDSPFTGTMQGVKKAGDTFIGEVEHVWIRSNPMLLWGKAIAVNNARGDLIAAIEAITVGEPEKSVPTGTQERYIGGLYSPAFKISGEGVSGAISGAIGSAAGGYGIYVTSKRLFIIRCQDSDAGSRQGVQVGTFIHDKFFGTAADTRERSLQELEKSPVFMANKENIMRIELKKPAVMSGHMTVTVRNGGSFRIYIDHKKAFSYIEKILNDFYPEAIWEE